MRQVFPVDGVGGSHGDEELVLAKDKAWHHCRGSLQHHRPETLLNNRSPPTALPLDFLRTLGGNCLRSMVLGGAVTMRSVVILGEHQGECPASLAWLLLQHHPQGALSK